MTGSMTGSMTSGITIWAPDGAPEISDSDDLAAVLVGLLGDDGLLDGDIVAVTSKVVAKAEGRVRAGDKDAAVDDETVRVVARRGATTIVRTRHGLTMAAAGVDASNVASGHVVLLPTDPDASASAVRRRLHELTGRVVGVLVTDTAGRAWREGQSDIAIGAAGIRVIEDFSGRADPHGNLLVVTAPAVADEIAGAVELAQGKLGRRPFAVVRGRADLVLPAGDDGTGAAALVRAEGADMFGLGSREAVVRALVGDPDDVDLYGRPAPAEELAAVLRELPGVESAPREETVRVTTADARAAWAAGVAAYAHGWEPVPGAPDGVVDLRPSRPLT
jgi:coenzyme F420-0:L-glutamate ligase/coenzyme F420-1:gamma-L-glutamate ligase